MQTRPICNANERIVVLSCRLTLNLFPDSIRLSSNMGFSYTKPYDILDTGCVLLAPVLCSPCLCGQVDDFTPFVRNWLPEINSLALYLDLDFLFGLARPLR